MPDPNEKFRIATVKVEDADIDVFILNPGDSFQGFGGSSAGLVVRKTASLITRKRGPHGWSDTEYAINDKSAWGWLLYLIQRKLI